MHTNRIDTLLRERDRVLNDMEAITDTIALARIQEAKKRLSHLLDAHQDLLAYI